MTRIRILVVDDSVVIRKVLSNTLEEDHELEVVGAASDGRLGLAKIAQLHPDLVTLDVEMPVMNGLETLAALRRLYPKLPVVMFSTLTEHGAAATLDALSLGASDYATKPSNSSGGAALAVEMIRAELIPKIKALCGRRLAKLSVPPPRPLVKVQRPARRRIEIVTIGSSTGGPNALAEVLPRIPREFPVPIVLVQHMPPIFTRLLAERLAAQCDPRSRSQRWSSSFSSPRMDRPGKLSYDSKRDGRRIASGTESGTAGEFLPPFGGRAVSLGRRGLRRRGAGGGDDWHGIGWSCGM